MIVESPYIILGSGWVFGIMQASLERSGVGRVEHLPNGIMLLVLGTLSIPLTLLSNIGLIGVSLWALFILKMVPTIITFLLSFVGWGLIWGSILAITRRSVFWEYLLSVGIPLLMLLKTITASIVIYLGYTLVQHQY